MKLTAILHKFKLIYLLWLAAPLLLWWALRDIHWAQVWAAVARLGLWQIAVLVAINILTLLSFTGRWWLILRALGYTIPYLTLTGYRTASFGVSYFTPGPQFGGEPLQVYLVERNHSVPGPAAAAATALDKILELLINFLFLAAGIALIGEWRLFPGWSGSNVLGAMLILLALPVGFLAASWAGWHPFTRLMRRAPQRVAQAAAYQRALRVVEESEKEVSQLCRERPATLIGAVVITVVSWFLILAEYWLGMYFLGLSLTPMQLMTAVTINRLAFLAPLPGGLGALESSQVLAMTVLGLPPASGVSQGLVIRTRDVMVGLVGLWIGWRAGRRRTNG